MTSERHKALASARSASLVRGTAYYLLTGFACPGDLELTEVHLRFIAHKSTWLVAGVGGKRDFSVPTTCILAVAATSRWHGWRRGWPGRLLRIRLKSGRVLLFGVSRPDEWAYTMRQPTGSDPCEWAEQRFRAASRTSALDVATTSIGVAGCMFVGWLLGPGPFFLALGAVVLGRMFVRARLWLRQTGPSRE